jgi:hypothetical protein
MFIRFYKNQKIIIYENNQWVEYMTFDIFNYNTYYNILEKIETRHFDVNIYRIKKVGEPVPMKRCEVDELIILKIQWSLLNLNSNTQIIDGILVEFDHFPEYELIENKLIRDQNIQNILSE